jgi:hypothetical protein
LSLFRGKDVAGTLARSISSQRVYVQKQTCPTLAAIVMDLIQVPLLYFFLPLVVVRILIQ